MVGLSETTSKDVNGVSHDIGAMHAAMISSKEIRLTVRRWVLLYYAILYLTIPYHTILYYTILYYTILYYTAL